MGVVIIVLLTYVLLSICALISLALERRKNKKGPEQFEDSDRYLFKREGWYGETEYYDRKEQKNVIK